MRLDQSKAIFSRAQSLIPGGVNSPVRAYSSVGGTPPHLKKGQGPLVWDEDGNEYVDMVLSYGPLILGHGNEEVKEALHSAVESGTTFGAPTRGELAIAELICERVAPVEMVRLVNSGTEATLSAARLARAATGRNRIIKFNGCYHGHGDSFLVRAGSGGLTLGAPDSPGVPKSLAELTLVAEYNDLEDTSSLFKAHPDDIAAIIVEPVAGNMGCILPRPGFLKGLRALCDAEGALLIFDEVMTGFRVARGSAQGLYGVRPDLTCLGKVVGGGMPAAAYGGRNDLMRRVAPAGDVYQAGTLSGNPVAMAAGLATLERLEAPGVYERLGARSQALAQGFQALAAEAGVELTTTSVGGMFGFSFHPGPVDGFAQAQENHEARFRRFFSRMMEGGVNLAPSAYETGFVSLAHTQADIDRTLEVARKGLQAAARVR